MHDEPLAAASACTNPCVLAQAPHDARVSAAWKRVLLRGMLLLGAAVVLHACGGGHGTQSPVTSGKQAALPAAAPAGAAFGPQAALVPGMFSAALPKRAPAAGIPKAGTAATVADSFRGNGWWWNPAEPGTGFAFEAQGNQGFVAFFLYEQASGLPTWYAAWGSFDGVSFVGSLNSYRGGQAASSSVYTPVTLYEAPGQVRITFSSGVNAQVSLPGGRVFSATRYVFRDAGLLRPAGTTQPEAGWWWNPNEGGRGYALEVQDNQIFLAMFHYRAGSGLPDWNIVNAPAAANGSFSGSFQTVSGGQSLTGAWRAATTGPSAGILSATFSDACTGELTMINGRKVAIQKFDFGGAALACRAKRMAPQPGVACVKSVVTGFNGNLELDGAGTGDGGGGSDGGSGVGGGLGKVLGGLVRVFDLSDGSLLGEAVTDNVRGLVTVKACGSRGPWLVRLEGRPGAVYYDEGLDSFASFDSGQALHALVDQWDEHVGISPYTEAAYRYAINQFRLNPADIVAGRVPLATAPATALATGLTKPQVMLANATVQAEVNARVTDGFKMSSNVSLPTPIDASSSTSEIPNSRYGRSAVVNGGSVKAARNYNPLTSRPALSLAAQVANDLSDGRIDGFALDGSAVAASSASTYESIRLPLGTMVASNAIANRFAAGTIQPPAATVDERTFVSPYYQRADGNYCGHFSDDIALMSDGALSVVRWTPPTPTACNRGNNDPTTKLRTFMTNVKQVTSGFETVFAVRGDGTVWGWGRNYCNSLGPGRAAGIYTQPVQLQGLSDVTSIAADYRGGVARDKNGLVYIWGIDPTGLSWTPTGPAGTTQCDVQASIYSPTGFAYSFAYTSVRQVAGLSNIVKVYKDFDSFFALDAAGRVYAWGNGSGGRLANGVFMSDGYLLGSDIAVPTLIPGLSGVRELAFGVTTVLALMNDGTVKVWGDVLYGLSADGLNRPLARPTTIPTLSGVRVLATNRSYLAMALKYDGTVWTWGAGDPYQGSLPTQVRPSSPVRHLASDAIALPMVYFQDGRISRQAASAGDDTPAFR